MFELTRTVRFCINPTRATDLLATPGAQSIGKETGPQVSAEGRAAWGAPDNSFAAFPSMRGLGRYYELEVCCRGEVDPATGYFLNIKQVDEAVRAGAIPAIERACVERPRADAAAVLRDLIGPLNAALGGRVASVRWRLTPYYCIEMNAAEKPPTVALVRQQFDFAASHRLHAPGMSDEQNRQIFGKCNNPLGHGHNYRVEPCVAVSLGAAGEPAISLQQIERIVNRVIVSRYDHKNLNEDTEEFAVARGGLNPSVENIARVCFDRLKPEIAAAPGGATLRSVTVWETDKTSSTYPAGAAY